MSASSDVPIFDAILIQRFCQDTKHLLPLQEKTKYLQSDKHTKLLMVNLEPYLQTGT